MAARYQQVVGRGTIEDPGARLGGECRVGFSPGDQDFSIGSIPSSSAAKR